MKKNYKGVCFDMDGTFFQNIKSMDYLCITNGKNEQLRELEIKENKEEITWIKAHYVRAKLAKGLNQSKIKDNFFKNYKLNSGIKECVTAIREKNMKVFLITSGPMDMAKIIADKFNFDEVWGSEFELKNKVYTGEIMNHIDGEAKLEKLIEFCKKYKIKLKDCIAVGDSISDVHIFDNCGKRLAINFTNILINRSDAYFATNNLKDIINFLI